MCCGCVRLASRWEFDENHFLVLDLVEPVDMLELLKKTAYKEKIDAEKWNEKVEGLNMVNSHSRNNAAS